MTIPTPPSTVQDVEGLIEEAAEASRFLRSPDSRGAWLKSNLLLMARVTEQLADALRSTTRQLEVAEEALREIEKDIFVGHDELIELDDAPWVGRKALGSAIDRIRSLRDKLAEMEANHD